MKKRVVILTCFLFLMMCIVIGRYYNNNKNTNKANSWFSNWSAINNLADYKFQQDSLILHEGHSACSIECLMDLDSFNGIIQSCQAKSYIGKRVRMSGFIKSKDLKGWAGLWMRIDSDSMVLNFDNMKDGKIDRSVRGNQEWKQYEIILDVPANSKTISYGVILSNKGKIWVDDLALDEVDKVSMETTGLTNLNISIPYLSEYTIHHITIPSTTNHFPLNLGFEYMYPIANRTL